MSLKRQAINERVEKFRAGHLLNAKFIGFEIIQTNPQEVVNDEACQLLANKLKKEQLSKKEHKPKIFVKINIEGIEIIEEKTNKIIFKHLVQRVLFISADKTDPRCIGYIYKSEGNEFIYFALKTEKPAQEFFVLLSELFDLLKETLMQQAAQQQQMMQHQQMVQQQQFQQQEQQNQSQQAKHIRRPSSYSSIASSRRTSIGSVESTQPAEIQEDLSNLSFEDKPLNCIRRLGSGSFGSVHIVNTENTNSKCVKLVPALKIFNSDSDLKEAYLIMQDAKLLTLKSAQDDYCFNLIKYYGVFEDDTNKRLGILTECVENGNLQQIIEYLIVNNQCMPEDKCIKWTFQMIKALDYLHSLGIIHRDIKTRNIYIQNDSVKLGDLGLARSFETFQKAYLRSNRATPNYMSPEMASALPFSFNTDVWSAGCVLFEMIKLKKAYDGQNFFEISTKIVDSEPPQLEASLIFKPLLNAMLQKDPEKRPTSSSLLAKLSKLQAYFEEFKDFI